MIVAIALTALLPQAVGELHLARPLSVAMQLSLWPLAYLLCALTMALTYRFGPARGVVRWKWILRASLIAAALWILGTFAFSWLVANYGSFNRTYGSLGSLVGFLTWLWLSLTLLLAGAEIACEFDRMDASHRQPDHRPQTAQRALVEQDVAAMAAGDVAGDGKPQA
jgi:membrane protein